MALTELDTPNLSSFCSIPQASITTLLEAPTPELVRTLLQNISTKVKEYNELSSEKLRSGVELEAAVRGQEAKNRALTSQVEKWHKEAVELRHQLQTQGAARETLTEELQGLRTSTSASSSELESLKSRIDSLEASNRTTLNLLDSKSRAHDELAGELNAQHQKNVMLRKQVTELEQSLETERNTVLSAKYREEGQKQTIAQLESNNDWLNNELKTKASEHTRLRKEKNQTISELRRQDEERSSMIQILERTEANLRRTLNEVSEKADERSHRIQTVQEEMVQKEQAFQVELDAVNRLAKLRENSAVTEKERSQDLSDRLEVLKKQASTEIGKLSAELETERTERDAAEAKIAELEAQVEKLEGDLANAHEREFLPGTPNKMIDGLSGISPAQDHSTVQAFAPGLSGVKGPLTKTQLYSENQQLKKELGSLKGAWDDLLRDLELKEPEIEEIRTENGRLESEIADLSSLIDLVGKERDQAVKAAKKQEGQVEAKFREAEVLRQQLRDLSSQVKMLLMEAHLCDQGQEDLGPEARAQLEGLAYGYAEDEIARGTSDTDKYISANLVTFRNLAELQEQNSKLLKITREIGERMEHEELLRQQTEAARNWEELQSKYERCKAEIKSLVIQSQSYIKERDMFRRMLSYRGQPPFDSNTQSQFGEAVNGNGNGPSAALQQAKVIDSRETSPSSKEVGDYAKLLKDMQDHFDSYRNEAATDQSTLKAQIDELSRTNSELRGEAIRSNSQVTLAHERYEMLQANYALLKSENSELQKRSQIFYEGAAKQDLRIQQATEDLIEARGLVDSMRSELANLKAEKDLWKTVEKRLNGDNESLMNERARLNSLSVSLQTLLNEREHVESETRRRLQRQVESLEKDLERTTTRLNEQMEENRRYVSRREYEHEQSQKRIDDLVSTLSTIKEELAKERTTKDHLSRQVDELTIELRSAKERLDVLQSASVASYTISDRSKSFDANGVQESSISQQQNLCVRVSELQRDLDLSKKELEDVKGQVEQYKAISQTSEEELNSLNQTQEIYQQETTRLVEEKDTKLKELKQSLDDTSSDLAATNTELGELRNQEAEHDRKIERFRKQYETQIAQLKDEHDRHANAAQYYQQALKAQANIAQQAQQNYESELLKHADAAKALQAVRAEFNQMRIELVEARTSAETARLSLGQSEDTWKDSRERFEREIAELKKARQDLKVQNDHLHQQLEMLTQIQKRASNDEEQVLEGSQSIGLDNLQEVIKYLRREKEIVEVQLELSSGEARRLRQQLDYTQSQLDDARLKLNQQRRAEEQKERSSLDHSKLMETVHSLNTHREANVTLRAENRKAQASLAMRTSEMEQLRAQVDPLQAEILDLKGEREAHTVEVKLLKENVDRWQQRAQSVLQKYDRVDPAELEALRDQAKTLEAERDQLASSTKDLQNQLDIVSGQLSQSQEQGNEQLASQKARLTEQFKGRSKTLSDRIREKDAALQTAMSERTDLEGRLAGLSELQSQLDTARAERDVAVEKAASKDTAPEPTNQKEDEEGQADKGLNEQSTQAAAQAAQAMPEAAETGANEEATPGVQSELAASRARIIELEAQIAQLQAANESLNITLDQLQASQQAQPDLPGHDGMVNKFQEDLPQAQQDAVNLPRLGPISVTIAGTTTELESRSVAEQVAEHAEAVRKELERRYNEQVQENERNFQKRIDAMKGQLTKKLSEGKAQIRQSLSTEHEQAMHALKAEHERETEALRARHKDELEELRRQEESRFAELRAIWEREHTAQAPVNAASTRNQEPISKPSWQPTEQEARAFVQSNEVVRGILRKNIASQVNKAKAELLANLKEEHEKSLTERLAEAEGKANTAKDHAVMMEAKKTAVQMNMANNQKRLFQFRLDIVQNAAQETPQKPVKEVWDTVKDAKLPQATIAQQPMQPVTRPPAASGVASSQPTAKSGNAHAVVPAQAQPELSHAQGAASAITVFGRPTPSSQPSEVESAKPQEQHNGKSAPIQPSTSKANLSQRPATLGVAQREPQNITDNANTGGGPAAQKALQSGLPVARGITTRGNSRGRASGIGRGRPGIDSAGAQEQPRGRGTPNSATLNAGAKQFVPGHKRPREEGQDGPQSNDGQGKRIRGGGAGS